MKRYPIPKSRRKHVLRRDGHRCVNCGETRALTVDHIRPVSKGGSNKAWNLQTLCANCNTEKADADPPRDECESVA